MTSRAFLFLFVALAAACGGIADSTLDGGGGDGGTSDGGPPPPPPSTSCPAAAPDLGATCAKEGLECEYGPDVRSTCNRILTCSKGSWHDSSGDDLTCPTGPNAAVCPATFEAAQTAGSCHDVGTACNYSTSSATRFCSCIDFGGPVLLDGGTPGSWSCGVLSEGCPATRPRIGEACSQPSLSCDYDACGVPGGLSFQCDATTGTWVVGPGVMCASANAN